MKLALKQLAIYNVHVDWSSHGYGYMLCAEQPSSRVLLGLNSRKAEFNRSNCFFFGEMKALSCAIMMRKVKLLVKN